MWIIVEGPDLAGKSTLCQALDERLAGWGDRPHRYRKAPPTAHPLDEYVRPMLSYRPHTRGVDRHVLCDRWHWGEAVYPHVLGRKTQLTPGVWLYIELFIRSRGGYVVWLNPSLAELEARYDVRGDGLIKRRDLAHIRAAYGHVARRSVLDSVMHDERHDVDEYLAGAILRARDAVKLSPFTTYVGPARPTTLYVGDARSTLGTVLAPAFMPYPSTSGAYLLDALAGMRTDGWHDTIGIANACDVDDIAALRRTLDAPNTVALGTNAHKRLNELGIPHARVPHPQFIRRFYHREQAAYGAVLRAAAIEMGDYSTWRP